MSSNYDVVVIGGGPAGSTAAIILARAGLDICLLEKDEHPRFHIGESLLPLMTPLLQELDLEEAVLSLPHVSKYGAEFGFGNDFSTRKFVFEKGYVPGSPVFNIERALFDKLLLDKARESGANVYEGQPVKRINRIDKDGCEVETATGTVSGRILLDASGQGTIVGRTLGLRRRSKDPAMHRVAYFQHFEGVERSMVSELGHPAIIMCSEGWFWLIRLNDNKTSIGFVAHPSFIRSQGIPPTRLLQWAIARCPVVRHRMRNASGSEENLVMSDYSYRCCPYAGDGYLLVGDAACFLDPIFSTGVTFAMMTASYAASNVKLQLRGEISHRTVCRRHCSYIKKGTAPYWKLIRSFYKHSFRELFMHGHGPIQMPGAIISILAGQRFPSLPWSLRWRLRAFEICVLLQRYLALSPRRPKFHLLKESPQPLSHITN